MPPPYATPYAKGRMNDDPFALPPLGPPMPVEPKPVLANELAPQLKPLFEENFEKLGELGAAVSVWQNGKPLIDLYGGFCDAGREKSWTADTVVLIWSATKGIASACVLHAL